MGFLRGAPKPGAAAAKAAAGAPTIGRLRDLLAPTNQRLLTYADAIGWFVDQRPPSGLAARGVILRAALRDGRIEVLQLFLDTEGQPVPGPHGGPCGRRLVVDGVDDELGHAFGDTDLLIVD